MPLQEGHELLQPPAVVGLAPSLYAPSHPPPRFFLSLLDLLHLLDLSHLPLAQLIGLIGAIGLMELIPLPLPHLVPPFWGARATSSLPPLSPLPSGLMRSYLER